ncbi:MAG: hypothetical protein WHT45_02260 [Ignavibacterium sp.]
MAEDKDNNKNKLKRIDESPSSIGKYLGKLDKEKQDKLIEKYLYNKVEIEKTKDEKVIKSMVAEHDLKIHKNYLDELTGEKRYYTTTQQVETGSGKIEIKVKGGDTKFIVPIITIIGIIMVIILAILFL